MEHSRINHFHSFFLRFPPFWVAWWNLLLSGAVPLRTWIIPVLCMVPTCKALSSCLWYQSHCHWTAVLVFKPPRFYLLMAPPLKRSDAGDSDIRRRSHEVLLFSGKVKVLDLLGHFVISHHHKEWWVQYNKIWRDHITITLLTVDCYNHFILLFVIVINLLLHLNDKWNFIMGMYV